MPHLIGFDSAWTWKPWNWARMVTHDRVPFFAEVALFLAAIGVSAFLWLACWRNRPQVVASKATTLTKTESIKTLGTGDTAGGTSG
jgi:hypothetical protein